MRRCLYTGTLLAAGLLAIQDGAACDVSDISLDQLKARPAAGDYVHIVGRIKNNCSTATGVQIKIILLDGEGNILKVDDLWPASVSNIPSHTDFPFDLTIESDSAFKRFEVRVMEVKTWRH